jgi:hypothetical protein
MAAPVAVVLALAGEGMPQEAMPPEQVAHGFGVGARTELLVEGASEISCEYDFGKVQVQGTFGAQIRKNTGPTANDVYGVTAAALLPIHRMKTADLSAGLGAGMIFNVPPAGSETHQYLLLGGLRIRVFLGQNFAFLGTLGVAALVGNDDYIVAIGARPLGAVGFVYYFR